MCLAACAMAMSSVKIGCDLEMSEPRSDAFVADYFTFEEQTLIAHASAADRPRVLALLWSAKESALKALHEGLRLDSRSMIVIPCALSFDSKGWSQLRVRHTGGRYTGAYRAEEVFHGWWQHADNMVRTVVAAPPPDPPILLRIPAYGPDAASPCA